VAWGGTKRWGREAEEAAGAGGTIKWSTVDLE